jgi:hypothetical protein
MKTEPKCGFSEKGEKRERRKRTIREEGGTGVVESPNRTRGQTCRVEPRSSRCASIVVRRSEDGVLGVTAVRSPVNRLGLVRGSMCWDAPLVDGPAVVAVSSGSHRDSVGEEETLVGKDDKVAHSLRAVVSSSFSRDGCETHSVLCEVVVVGPARLGFHGVDGDARTRRRRVCDGPLRPVPAAKARQYRHWT